mgnify:CR=1 FL=1
MSLLNYICLAKKTFGVFEISNEFFRKNIQNVSKLSNIFYPYYILKFELYSNILSEFYFYQHKNQTYKNDYNHVF